MTTILFADDERLIRQICKEELELEGFHVVLAEDGEDALEAILALTIDVVILDQHMLRHNGLETARQIRQINPELPIILFTADRDLEVDTDSLVDAMVAKTDDLSDLKSAVRNAMLHR